VSVDALKWAIELEVELPLGARLVLWFLAWKTDDERGEAWPSLSTIASATGLDRRTVTRSLSVLENGGLLTRSKGSTARHEPSSYTLLPRGVTPLGLGAYTTGARGNDDRKLGASRPPKDNWKDSDTRRKFFHDSTGSKSGRNNGSETVTDERGTFLPGTGWIS
jgi:DNA-binding transcriptional ArsR family regulator